MMHSMVWLNLYCFVYRKLEERKKDKSGGVPWRHSICHLASDCMGSSVMFVICYMLTREGLLLDSDVNGRGVMKLRSIYHL